MPSVRPGGAAKAQIGSLEAQAQELQAQIADLDLQLEASTEAYNRLVLQLDENNVSMTSLRQEQDTAQQDYRYRLEDVRSHASATSTRPAVRTSSCR